MSDKVLHYKRFEIAWLIYDKYQRGLTSIGQIYVKSIIN